MKDKYVIDGRTYKLAQEVRIENHGDKRFIFVDGEQFPWFTSKTETGPKVEQGTTYLSGDTDYTVWIPLKVFGKVETVEANDD